FLVKCDHQYDSNICQSCAMWRSPPYFTVAVTFHGLPFLRPGVVEEVDTPPGSCPQGCGFASVALPHRNEIPIMRSAHFLWRSCHVQGDLTSEPTSGKQFARTLVRACVGGGRGSWKGAGNRWQWPSGVWGRFGRRS